MSEITERELLLNSKLMKLKDKLMVMDIMLEELLTELSAGLGELEPDEEEEDE